MSLDTPQFTPGQRVRITSTGEIAVVVASVVSLGRRWYDIKVDGKVVPSRLESELEAVSEERQAA